MLRILILTIVSLFASSAVIADPQAFTAAKPEPPDGIAPESFAFNLLTWKCEVSALGVGNCHHGKQRWRFRLPVDDGRIDTLLVHAGETFVFVYSLTDEESSWGKAVGLVPRARSPQWSAEIAGLNLAMPLASDESVLVGALGFVASVKRLTGEFQWRHDFVYDGSGRTKVTLDIVDGVVSLASAVPWRLEDVVTVCYALETGVVVPCPRKPSPYGGSMARLDRAAVLLPAGVVSTSVSTPSHDISREFARYPGERRLTGTPARPKLNTARARRFRTVLRQAASEGPNFNGHYRIVYWGCGTNCIEWAVINLTNGAVWFAERPVSSCWAPGVEQPNFPDWFEHRLDSRLFHLYECIQGSMDQMRTNRHVYVWSGTRPRLLRVEPLQ